MLRMVQQAPNVARLEIEQVRIRIGEVVDILQYLVRRLRHFEMSFNCTGGKFNEAPVSFKEHQSMATKHAKSFVAQKLRVCTNDPEAVLLARCVCKRIHFAH